jgi:hypothetical protein
VVSSITDDVAHTSDANDRVLSGRPTGCIDTREFYLKKERKEKEDNTRNSKNREDSNRGLRFGAARTILGCFFRLEPATLVGHLLGHRHDEFTVLVLRLAQALP